MTDYTGLERRTGLDRRKGPRRVEDETSISVEAPGGFKASLTGARSFLYGLMIGGMAVMGVWLWTIVKVVH